MSSRHLLASVFNRLHIRNHLNPSRTGLFGIDALQSPDGFHELRERASDEAQVLVQRIIQSEPQETVSLFDELSNCLCKVADLAEFVRVGHPQPRFRATAEQASVAISSLVERLNTNAQLYQSLKRCKGHHQDPVDRFVSELFIVDFEQNAIHLDEQVRRRVFELNESLLQLGSLFAANANQPRLIHDRNKLPESVRQHFSQNLVTSLEADASRELIRETGYRLYLQPDQDQAKILGALLGCRQELAHLCGFPSYAHRAVAGSIAGSPEVVNDFLGILNDRLRPQAQQDYKQMLDMKRHDPQALDTGRLNAWDVPYYSASYKRSIYNDNILQCLPYFSLGVCMDGLNMIFEHLYGVRMEVEECRKGELWHADVIKLAIRSIGEGQEAEHANSSELLGHIYCDLFERNTKQVQDCHHTIQGGFKRHGEHQLPIVVLMLSLPAATQEAPSLLSPSQVDNLFHEMGHAMHSMLAQTKYQHVTGTRCHTDLAEVPSILMEYFASDPRVVSRFARHHATGEPLSADLLRAWLRSKSVFGASETQLQVFYSALDQAYHSGRLQQHRPASQGASASIDATTELLAATQRLYYPDIAYVPGTAWQLRFAHLVGYGAKYYSYLVSRAVASAIWSRIFSHEPLSRLAGGRFQRELLAHGGGKAAAEIAEELLGCRVDADFIARSLSVAAPAPADVR